MAKTLAQLGQDISAIKDSLAALFKGRESENEAAVTGFREQIESLSVIVKSELAAAKSSLEVSDVTIATLTAQLALANAQSATLTASQSDFDAKLAKAASAKALEITQAQGIPALPIPKDSGVSITMPRKQFEALSPQKQTEFFKNGGKITV